MNETQVSRSIPHAKKPTKPRFLSPLEFVEKWEPIVRKRFFECEIDYSHRYQAVCVHDMRNPKAIREQAAFTNAELGKHNFTEREVMERVERILAMSFGAADGPL